MSARRKQNEGVELGKTLPLGNVKELPQKATGLPVYSRVKLA